MLYHVGIYRQLIPNWIESTQAQILFTLPVYIRDTEPNSKYYLEEYLNIYNPTGEINYPPWNT